jgi:ketosteroid isomerase-like protein
LDAPICTASGPDRIIASPKRLHISLKILAISALFLCRPAIAQGLNGWEFDSLRANSNISKADAQQVHEVMLKMLDRWNAHDIEGYMETYWKSPELLVVIDSEQFNGWQQLHDSYVNGYPNRIAMGFIQPKRIQVKLLKSDFALALTWWSASFPSSQETVVGTSTMNLQKLEDGWKIVASHTSISAM